MTERVEIRDTFDRIAPHFALTRPKPWMEVIDFLEGRTGVVGIDIGVGNGRHAEVLSEHTELVIGIDTSTESLQTAINRAHEKGFDLRCLLADASTLPLDSNSVDIAVYIATIHHLPTRNLRVSSLNELERVLKPAGVGLISAWSTRHERFNRETGFDTHIDWVLPNGETVPRYYHIYDPEEFRSDIESSHLTCIDHYISHGNCYALVGVNAK